MLKRAGAMPVGESPGRSWLAGRYAGPHLRDDLLDRGVLVETLETATSWSNLEALKTAVTRALEGTLAAPLVMCHVSHLYATGASLYFTALAAQDAPIRSASGSARRPRRRTRSSRPAARSPTTTPSARDHAPWMPARSACSGTTCCACSRSAATRPG